MNHSALGRSITKVDVLDKVLGQAKYGDDIEFPNMLYAKLLRGEYPHATILGIDVSKAVKLPGVKAVITAKDVPVNNFGILVKDQVILAADKVCYMGDPVAAVAAESEEIAEDALELMEVTYQELPSVFDAREALRPEAPKIHEGGNLAGRRKIRAGDVENGFNASDEIVEDDFCTQKMEHCHMEPRAGTAMVSPDKKVTIWSSLPLPFVAQTELARVLRLPMTKVRIVQPECGGNFGGRNEISIEPHIALLAMKARQPVRMVWSREEEFIGSTTRHSYYLKYKTGVKKDGHLIAREVEIISDAGAYTSFGPSALTKGCILACGPYRIPNIKVDGYLAFTNNPVGGAMRGFGAPQVYAAEETHMDHIASRLGIGPLELRLRNIFKNGDQTATGQVLHSVGLSETISKASEAASWNKHRTTGDRGEAPIKVGRGMACMFYPIGNTERANPSVAFVKINPDGTVIVHVGILDVGQGARTVLAQIAAEALGIAVENIRIISGDTDSDPYDFGCVASRGVYVTGNAVRLAATAAKELLLQAAAEKLSVNMDGLETRNGMIYAKGCPEKCVPISEAALTCQEKGKPIVSVASFNPSNAFLDQETGQGTPYPTYAYATQIAEVEVDTRTGFVKVLRVVAAHDVGKAINEDLVRGQISGGIGFGLGQALMENMAFDNGRNLNPNFVDYVVPTAADMPKVEILIVEEPDPTGPFGAKGLAEPANVPTAPAILNAIFDAVGVMINDLPATPERVLKALKHKIGN
jgi:CO/xanthine dehydrogenase Mo-binding subunit